MASIILIGLVILACCHYIHPDKFGAETKLYRYINYYENDY